MDRWTADLLDVTVYDYASLSDNRRAAFDALMDTRFPPSVYGQHRAMRRNALRQSNRTRELLAAGTQHFPPFVPGSSLVPDKKSLEGTAIVFTAGGEGERLRLSLHGRGITEASLRDFTKATFPLPEFAGNPGTLHINLLMVAALCRETGIDIPVVITTGPAGSVTAQVIPRLVEKHGNFGLKHIRIIGQNERLFLTDDEKIVFRETAAGPVPVTHPDETGGPVMKLKEPSPEGSVLEWMNRLGTTRTIIVQATALYNQSLLPLMAAALDNHDCLGVGILRSEFPPTDPYGTYVSIDLDGTDTMQIIEQDVRNEATRSITDTGDRWHLPFNTGFYAFDNTLLAGNDLPDFATPPKVLRPDLPRTPKIGYAATDLVSLAKNPVILTIESSLFGVLKNADDLKTLSALGKQFGFEELCR